MLSNSNSSWPEAPSSTLTGPGTEAGRSRDIEAALVEEGWRSEAGGWRSRDTGPVRVQWLGVVTPPTALRRYSQSCVFSEMYRLALGIERP